MGISTKIQRTTLRHPQSTSRTGAARKNRNTQKGKASTKTRKVGKPRKGGKASNTTKKGKSDKVKGITTAKTASGVLSETTEKIHHIMYGKLPVWKDAIATLISGSRDPNAFKQFVVAELQRIEKGILHLVLTDAAQKKHTQQQIQILLAFSQTLMEVAPESDPRG